MDDRERVSVTLVSFGFKHGMPDDMNYLLDVRCLPNPHWVDELRPGTGRDHDVSEYVVGSAAGRDFLKYVKPMLVFLVRQNREAGKKEMKIAVGCTGGRHRSVAIVEALSGVLGEMEVDLQCQHRDIDRGSR